MRHGPRPPAPGPAPQASLDLSVAQVSFAVCHFSPHCRWRHRDAALGVSPRAELERRQPRPRPCTQQGTAAAFGITSLFLFPLLLPTADYPQSNRSWQRQILLAPQHLWGRGQAEDMSSTLEIRPQPTDLSPSARQALVLCLAVSRHLHSRHARDRRRGELPVDCLTACGSPQLHTCL